MPKLLLPLLSALCLLSALPPAFASSSEWIETQGGRVRLVTAGTPDAKGRLKGALEIALKPGWKTYWRDPGDAGVAPSLDVAESINVSAAEIRFPPPERFDDGYSVWAGYDQPVSLPVTFTIERPDRFTAIDATVFLGICETICIPVQGEVSLDPGSEPDNPRDAATVQAAFAALPVPATESFGVTQWRREGEAVVVEAELFSGATKAELFLADAGGFAFGTPERIEKDGRTIFKAPILDWPGQAAKGAKIPYVLIADGKAVAGHLPAR